MEILATDELGPLEGDLVVGLLIDAWGRGLEMPREVRQVGQMSAIDSGVLYTGTMVQAKRAKVVRLYNALGRCGQELGSKAAGL